MTMPPRPDPEAVAASFDAHRATPHVDLRRHTRNRQIELADSLRERRKIYLDLKFWIKLREAEGPEGVPAYRDLLDALRRVVSSGRAFCPISDSCFLEVFKQTDPATRRRTAALIDELSLGVSILPLDLRIGTEIAHLLHAGVAPDQVFPLDDLVWTKLSNVLGYFTPSSTVFDAATELTIQKAFFDHTWFVSLVEMEEQLGDSLSRFDSDFHARLAEKLTCEILEHASNLKTFGQAYEHELLGVLDLYADRAADVLLGIAPAYLGPRPPKGSDKYKEIERQSLSLLMAVMKTERGKATMRTVHIETCMHAAVRWNKGQKFKPNDFFDYQHAAAAVGYCDAFFTERSLAAVLTRSDLALDKLYGCKVTFTPEVALEYINLIC